MLYWSEWDSVQVGQASFWGVSGEAVGKQKGKHVKHRTMVFASFATQEANVIIGYLLSKVFKDGLAEAFPHWNISFLKEKKTSGQVTFSQDGKWTECFAKKYAVWTFQEPYRQGSKPRATCTQAVLMIQALSNYVGCIDRFFQGRPNC